MGKNFSNYRNLDSLIVITKIVIIVFSAYSITANFLPFYEGANPFFYGVNSVLFSEGQFSITNELLQEFGWPEIVPENWLLTEHGTAVPMSGTGLMVAGSLFYLVGGYYGLFFLSPICFVLLLIVSERTSSKLFGDYVGLVTLLIIASSNLLFRNSIALQTESIFSLLFVIGVYYLIKFLRVEKNYLLIISTVVFTLSTWIRLNGLMAFPIEIFIISAYFLISFLKEKKSQTNSSKSQLIIKKIKNKKIFKVTTIIMIPWLIFFISHAAYYEYNFGNLLVNYGDVEEFQDYDPSISAIFKFEYKDYENIKQFSKYLLPYQISAVYNSSDENFDKILGNNWIGLISISSLLAITIISFYTKDKRTEIFVLMMFIIGIVWFFSSITTEYRAEQGVPGRYMLPAFVLASMIFGYFLQKIIKKEIKNKNESSKILTKFSKVVLLIIIGVFFIFAFYFSNPIQIIIEEGWNFRNPEILAERYPLNAEGLSEDSIIVTTIGVRAVEYGFISFNPKLSKEISSDSVNLLENIINKGHDVYTFKVPFTIHEKNMIISLVNEHGFTLKEHSETFCSVEVSSSEKSISDKNCFSIEPIRIPQT